MASRQKLVVKVLLLVAALVVALPFFWFFGGIRWLETRVFPPRRLKNMPQNAIWIDAPELPISWHHGWWFGCATPSSGEPNRCRVVLCDGSEVYAGDFLPCASKLPLPVSEIDLVFPADGMWIADKRLATLAPIGALRNGDFLVPVPLLDRCSELKGNRNAAD